MKPGKLPCILSRIGTAGSAFIHIMTNSVTFEAGDSRSWALVLEMSHTTITTLDCIISRTGLALGWPLNAPVFLAPTDDCFPPLLK